MVFIQKTGTGVRGYLGVHGWAGDHRTFAPLSSLLPEGECLYALDLPGWGKSPAPVKWDLDEYAAALQEAVNMTGLDEITLIGYCGGANLCLEALLRGLTPVRRLVMIDPFAFAPWYLALFTWGEFGRRAYYATFANSTGRWIANAALRKKRKRGRDMTRSFVNINHDAALRFLRMLCETKDLRCFRGLEVDVDIAYGANTFAAVKKGMAIWREIFPRAGIFELAGAGHEPLREVTTQLADIIFQSSSTAAGNPAPRETPPALTWKG